MTVQDIPVKTMGPAQTEWTDSTAAAHQGLTGRDVKQVSLNTNTLCLDDTILSSLILRVKLGP